jgi:hypothetical protein
VVAVTTAKAAEEEGAAMAKVVVEAVTMVKAAVATTAKVVARVVMEEAVAVATMAKVAVGVTAAADQTIMSARDRRTRLLGNQARNP